MPEYRRKKAHSRTRQPKRTRVKKFDNITIQSDRKIKRNISRDISVRVVRGKKGEKQRKLYIFAAVIAVIVSAVVLLSVLLPVGILECAKDFAYSLGSGSFPASISGSQTLNCVPKDNYYYVLTDTSVMAFSNGGRNIFSSVHGFSSPVIVTSQTRALVFDQGKNAAIIYNLSGVVDTIESKNEIIAADIAKDGQYALVTKSESFASSVTVYSRSGKSIYNIKFARDMVNNVDIASSGKKVAVSTVNADSGKITSSIRIFDFNSADPKFKLDLDGETVYDVESTGRGFFVTTHNKLRFIGWSRYSVNEFEFDGEVSSIRYSGSGTLVVYNKTNDKSNSSIALFSNYGKNKSEFDIKGIVNDIRFSRGRVYFVGDNKITIYNKHGDVLRSDSCNFGAEKLAVIGSNNVCVITDSAIIKVSIEKGA